MSSSGKHNVETVAVRNDRGKLTVEVQVPGTIHHDGQQFIAACPSLDVVTQGATVDEAKLNLEDAVFFFVESCVERGTLFQVLQEAGFAYDPNASSMDEDDGVSLLENEEYFHVRVPLPFVINAQVRNEA